MINKKIDTSWKGNNDLLREDWNTRHRCYEKYYEVKFSYNTEKERDEAFDYFNDDDFKNYNMAIPRKEGDIDIIIIKYVCEFTNKRNKGEDINEWIDEIAERTGAYHSEVRDSSYDAYHDAFLSLDESHSVGGDFTFILTFESEYDRWNAFKKFKKLGYKPVLLEHALDSADFVPRYLEKAADSREALLVPYLASEGMRASQAIMEFLDKVEDEVPKILNIWDEENF